MTSTRIVLIMTAHTFASVIMLGNPITMVNSILSLSILINVMPMPASTMPVILTLPVLLMINFMFLTVTSVRSQLKTVNTIPSVLTSTSVMPTLVSHMLVTLILHAQTTMVLMFASVMTAGSQTLMVSSIPSASTLMNATMELKRVISTQPVKIQLAHRFAIVYYLQLTY